MSTTPTPAAVKLILVTGATGKQGNAFISALRPKDNTVEPTSFHILALTRKADSPSANKLSLEKHVTVVEGDLDDATSLKKVFEDAKEKGGIWGVFCVLAFPGLGANADGEEKQGKVCINCSAPVCSLTSFNRHSQIFLWNSASPLLSFPQLNVVAKAMTTN